MASALLEDSQFIKYIKGEAQKKKINIDDEGAQREFVTKLIRLGITDKRL